jgi:1-acyl-sn-glycerol-3-phosphate acyltransferase
MFYWIIRFISQVVFLQTMRIKHFRLERTVGLPGCLLACSHVSHLDPVCFSVKIRRKIYWMARKEFYRSPLTAGLMKAMDAFPVNRQGVATSAIKTAIRRVKEGEMVGIFPEGEVKQGTESVLRGGPIKHGVFLISQRTNCPILPCVILGSDKLSTVQPWLPALRGRLWMIYGDTIHPTPGLPRREQRQRMADELKASFEALYVEARDRFHLPDTILP